MHWPVKTKKKKFHRSASGNSTDNTRTARDEVDVSAYERHISYRRNHEDKFHVQILVAKVALFLSDNHGQHRLAKSCHGHLHLARVSQQSQN